MRPLRGDEQVEAELPPLRRDSRGVLGRERRHLVARLARTDVVRLVDHDQHGLTLGTPPPQRREHALRRDRLLAGRAQRAEVDDEAARAAGCDEVLDRVLVAERPDLPAVDAEVAQPRPERLVPRLGRGEQRLHDSRRTRSGLRRGARLEQLHERAVLIPVADRVEPQHSRLLGGVAVHETDVEPLGSFPCPPHLERAGSLHVARSETGFHVAPHLAEADEVRVRVEDDDPQRRLEQEPLEDRAERVRLSRAGLAAEERVPVEAARVEGKAHRRLERQLADVERGALWPRAGDPGCDRLGARRGDGLVVERSAVAFEHDAVAACDPDHQRGSGRVATKARIERARLDPGVLDHVHVAQTRRADRHVAARL